MNNICLSIYAAKACLCQETAEQYRPPVGVGGLKGVKSRYQHDTKAAAGRHNVSQLAYPVCLFLERSYGETMQRRSHGRIDTVQLVNFLRCSHAAGNGRVRQGTDQSPRSLDRGSNGRRPKWGCDLGVISSSISQS